MVFIGKIDNKDIYQCCDVKCGQELSVLVFDKTRSKNNIRFNPEIKVSDTSKEITRYIKSIYLSKRYVNDMYALHIGNTLENVIRMDYESLKLLRDLLDYVIIEDRRG